MGISILNGLFLVEARANGAHFDATLTLGRLASFLSPRDWRRLANALGDALIVDDNSTYMDSFLAALGARRLDVLDADMFEGAQLVHDLNKALPETLLGQYDAVVDGGTLEHVFNVPTAFRNAMDALKIGGHFFGVLPANNQCGHGFYQFSAEFFYRVFSAQNGFEVVKLLVAPTYAGGRWLDGPAFEVADPEQMGARVNIYGRKQMVFLVQAKKLAQKAVFTHWPQQSDYAATWSAAGPSSRARDRISKRREFVVHYLSAVGRLGIRCYERWAWARQSRANPALRPHNWRH